MLRQGILIVRLATPMPGAVPRGHGAALVPFAMFMVSALAPDAVSSDPGIERLTLRNGLDVTIHSSERLRERVTTLEGRPAILLDDERALPVITDINDSSIPNKGDGRFHPFPRRLVVQALEALELDFANMPVTVYLLPYPRRDVLTSSTVGFEIFLGPHVLPIAPETASYIVAHEVGHAFCNWFLPEGSPDWERYRQMRGVVDRAKFSASAKHAYRPKEIFAEDFRVLFGGAAARFGGYVENPELSNPERIPGLFHFLTAVAKNGPGWVLLESSLP